MYKAGQKQTTLVLHRTSKAHMKRFEELLEEGYTVVHMAPFGPSNELILVLDIPPLLKAEATRKAKADKDAE